MPWTIALNLTFPETVTEFNRQKMQSLVKNGPHPPPGQLGAKYIIREDGRRINLAFLKKESDRRLELNDKVGCQALRPAAAAAHPLGCTPVASLLRLLVTV